MEKNLEKNVCVCVCVNHFAIHLKLMQHCKSTILQFKKRNEVLMHAMTWMKFENVRPGEISQSQKDKCCMIPHV